MKAKVVKVINESGHELPAYATEHSAGVDLRAKLLEPLVLPPNHSTIIPTGLSVELPEGYELQIRPRSGLAAKNLVTVLNSPATIDGDFRGEIKVILINHGNADFVINNGDRIGQAVLHKYEKIQWKEVLSLSETKRGSGGLGSTGVN
jgi:dUTP pyrophosphatase